MVACREDKKRKEEASMKIKGMKRGLRLLFFFGIVGTFLGLGVPAFAQPPENWTTGIAYDVVPEAKITKVGWYMGKTQSGQMLIYEVGIKNVSDKPWRFKLTIYPIGTEPIAGYYPRTVKKGKPLALEPNKELVQKFPVFLKEMPKGFALVVSKMEE